MRQAVDQIKVHGTETQFTGPCKRLLGHDTRLNTMDGLLHLRIEVLNAKRGAVKPGFAQSDDVFASQPARIDFYAGLEILGKGEVAMDDLAQPADFVRRKEGRRAAAPVELHGFPARIEQRAHLGHFLFQIINVGLALLVIERDDGRATTKPAKRFAKWNMKVKREIPFAAIVLEDTFGQLLPGERVGEFGRRRIRGVARAGDVVFLHQVEIYLHTTHSQIISRLFSARRPRTSHGLDQALNIFELGVGRHSVAEIENVPRPSAHFRQDAPRLASNNFRRGTEQKRIKISLDCHTRR